MKIKKVSIKNFRAIDNLPDFELKNLAILIGDNGTSKTSILEAINFCLSPHFLSGRIKHTDFYNGVDEPIEITLEFDEVFKTLLPDGYTKQAVECNKVYLEVKKRERAANEKAFSDIVVVSHYVMPIQENLEKTINGQKVEYWEKERKSHTQKKPSIFQFDKRLLSFPVETEGLPKSFYFAKNREKQLQRGFNSSISSVFDDFNWRFTKEIRKPSTGEVEQQTSFFTNKQNLEKEIIDKVDDKSQEKTFQTLNKKLEDLGIANVDLSFIDGNAPFDTAFLCQKLDNLDLSVSRLGSGVEMIISLLFLETMASLAKENFIVLIDEPELHLHPLLQDKFVNYLIGLSSSNQVLLSTHSPYFFKNCLSNDQIELLISKKDDRNKISLENTGNQNFGLFPWSPSWGEINYFAYNLPTFEFHNELYGFLQEKQNAYTETLIEQYFVNNKSTKSKKWIKVKNGTAEPAYDSTLMTYIRNSIHHPENTQNIKFTDQELKTSIDEMIKLMNPTLLSQP